MSKYQIKKVSRHSVKKEWLKLCSQNIKTTPFQEWPLHEAIATHYLFFSLASKERPCYFRITRDDEVIMIAPLAKRYTLKGCYYTSFGATATIAFQDFIYADNISMEDMNKCLELLKQKCGKILFYNVPQDSKLYNALTIIRYPFKENINITIPSHGSYDDYYGGLDKHARQNMRTAYNRMKTDEMNWSFEVIQGEELNSEVKKELMNVYLCRRKSRYRATSALHEWFIRHYHFNTIALSRLSNAYYAILRINGKVAAFLAGYTNTSGKYILVPRLAINNEYQRYSPGVVLISETMKVLKTKIHVDELDLSKGNDKYKLTMGGGIYYTYNFEL